MQHPKIATPYLSMHFQFFSSRFTVTKSAKHVTPSKNLTHSVTTHVTDDLLPGKSVTRTQKPDTQCYHPCNP